ncbi:MAG: LamG domain-containing protein [Nitrososphaerota archaeon]|nr:LamG domain-containing protein [Nitrososphaerota archaeon]
MSVSGNNPMPIIGYCDRLSVRPGEKINFMVSCDFSAYSADIVRFIHADPNKIGPGLKVELVKTAVTGRYRGKKESYPQGSYVEVQKCDGLNGAKGITLQAWIMPTLPAKGLQAVMSVWGGKDGFGMFVDKGGCLTAGVRSNGKVTWAAAGRPLRASAWYFVACSYDPINGRVTLREQPVKEWPGEKGVVATRKVGVAASPGFAAPVIIGAYCEDDKIAGCFNGKIDRPRVFARALEREQVESLRNGGPANSPEFEVVADWDFSKSVSTDDVIDQSEFQSHGKAVNSPKRAVTGYNWTGRDVDFRLSPSEYGAIHFHEDDLDDARWKVDIEFEVPKTFRSAVYALRMEAKGYIDYVPFFVLPPRGKTTSSIAFLVPTLSYLAYGNDHVLGNPELQETFMMPPGFKFPRTRIDKYLVKTNLMSLYDSHTDRSGVCHVSRLRPILTMRPDYLEAFQAGGKGAPHQFPADLWIIDWMEAKGFGYDVITDEDLHQEGFGLVKPYDVVMTGTHPEYWTEQMLNSIQRYLDEGGRVMYMGGNGFYWVTSVNEDKPHVFEVRRWGGSQSWTSQPGEYHHSSTGEMGGLWRNRGRAPQKMLGVGFTSQGHGPNRTYRRLKDSFDPRAAFIFRGIGKDEVIGDFDNLDGGPGAAGYEFDRFDHALGTPAHALLLASATDFTDDYQLAIEEVDSADSKQGGSINDRVRADMVYFEYPKGGAVFSTGSVSWSGSLFYNAYKNNVSKITENVLREFSKR